MLPGFSLATARDRHWWSHWRFLGSPDTSTSFFEKTLEKGAVDLPYNPVSQLEKKLKKNNGCTEMRYYIHAIMKNKIK